MDRTERFYKIDQLLNRHKSVPIDVLLGELEVSPATFKRDLDYLRDRLHAPIVWDRALRGYRFDTPNNQAPRYALPGLWLNASEAHALLTMQHLLANLEPGILSVHVQPLLARLRALLDTEDHAPDEIAKRIRILPMARRTLLPGHFETIASAVLKRTRLHITYYSRTNHSGTERQISPQRLVHYRENWYLDAWCHLRNDLRSFSVDSIRHVKLLNTGAKKIADKILDAVLGSGYGIFAGKKTTWAKLRFTPHRARWVACETWHPKQKGSFEKDGSYLLEIPYSDPRELIMDILKYGPDVEVLAPQSLRKAVYESLAKTATLYK